MSADPFSNTQRPLSVGATAVEWWLVGLLFLTGLGLRAAFPSRLAVEQFDEGVYASNVFFTGETGDERYPEQHLYAPPLLPEVIFFVMSIAGPSNAAAISVNIIAGSLMVPLVWWVGRNWFGPAGGLASATLVALNDVHIFFSRTALTDILLCFFLTAAVQFICVALTTRSRFAVLSAGAVTGLAWWTKYNGWLPLAIGLAGLVPWRLLGRLPGWTTDQTGRLNLAPNIRLLAGSLARWGIVALVAFLIWLPWLRLLDARGGYAAIAANHRGYIVGLAGWWDSLVAQTAKLHSLSGSLSNSALPAALFVTLIYVKFSVPRFTWNRLLSNRRILIGVLLICCMPVIFGLPETLCVLTAAAAFSVLRRKRPAGDVELSSSRQVLAGWLVTAWFVGLLATTPLYTPYPRLTLPFLTVCWLGAGMWVGSVRDQFAVIADKVSVGKVIRSENQLPNDLPAVVPAATYMREALLFSGLVALTILPVAFFRSVPGWQSRTSLADQTPSILDAICENVGVNRQTGLDRFAISTYADPALLFQMRLAGVSLVSPLVNLNFARPEAPPPLIPRFVLIGPRAGQTAGFDDQFAAAQSRLELIATYHYRPSDLVILDGAHAPDSKSDEELKLYRVK